MISSRRMVPNGLSGAVFQQDARIVSEHGIANRRIDANAGRRSRNHQRLDAARPENGIEIGCVEPAVPRLVDTVSPAPGLSSSTMSVFQVSLTRIRLSRP